MEQVSFPQNKEQETVTSHQAKVATATLFPDYHKQAGLSCFTQEEQGGGEQLRGWAQPQSVSSSKADPG